MPLSPDEAVALARAVVSERYPEADAAIVAGSVVRGEATAGSDLDLVVLFAALPAARRQSFLWDGVPVEAFLHDPQTLRWFFQRDVERRRPVLISMVAEGAPIGPRVASVAPLVSEAREVLRRGPPALKGEALDRLRYEITDKLDDLRDPRPAGVRIAIAAALHGPLAELALGSRGGWLGAGKWIPRMLRRADAAMAEAFDAAFSDLFVRGESDRLIALAESELDRVGGRLFDGDDRAAAPDARLP
jgi:hypothetical protein